MNSQSPCRHFEVAREHADTDCNVGETSDSGIGVFPIYTAFGNVLDCNSNLTNTLYDLERTANLEIAEDNQAVTDCTRELTNHTDNILECCAVLKEVLEIPDELIKVGQQPKCAESRPTCAESLERGDIFHEIGNALCDFPRRKTRTDSTHRQQDFSKTGIEQVSPRVDFLVQTEPFFHLLNNLINLRADCAIEEIIGRQVKAKTSTSDVTDTTCTAPACIFGRRDDVQFINTEQSVFQLFRLFGSVTKTVSDVLCTVSDSTDSCADTAVINFRQSKPKQACDSVRNKSNNLCYGNRIRQDSVQSRNKDITDCTGALSNLCLQDAELVCGSVQRSRHIALRGCYLRHNRVVTQLRFLSLCHSRDFLLNTEGICFLL